METITTKEAPAADTDTGEELMFSPVATVEVEGELISNCGCQGFECGCSGDCGCDGD